MDGYHRIRATIVSTIVRDTPKQFWLDLRGMARQAYADVYAQVQADPNIISEQRIDRLPTHEVWPVAVQRGATHVMAHTTPAGEKARLDEERDLIRRWNPELNSQHRTTG